MGRDYRALPDFWVLARTNENAAGWGPHRDRCVPTLDPDNSPHTLTVWLPFTDATPLNGCMYVLPGTPHDDRFVGAAGTAGQQHRPQSTQDIRALPATAGSMLAWNQAVLHWGSRGSRLGTGPRISAAFEFQRADRPAFNSPLLDPHRIPSFSERLGLIGKRVLRYRHMYPLPDDVAAIATTLFGSSCPALWSPAALYGIGLAGSRRRPLRLGRGCLRQHGVEVSLQTFAQLRCRLFRQ